MIVVNTETIPGYAIREMKGLVQGNTHSSQTRGTRYRGRLQKPRGR